MGKFLSKYLPYGLVLTLFLLASSGCNAINESAVETDFEQSVDSPLQELLLGAWHIDHGRFGAAVFEFRENGILVVSTLGDPVFELSESGTLIKVESGLSHEMNYIFVDEDTLQLSGYEEFSGTADINISGDNMEFSILFTGDVFQEIYPDFVRIRLE